jgi:hypothetical protein
VPMNRWARGMLAAALIINPIVAFWLGWGIKSCAVWNPSFVWYYAFYGPLIGFFVTIPVPIFAFILGYSVSFSVHRFTLVLASILAVTLALVGGYLMTASGCSPL